MTSNIRATLAQPIHMTIFGAFGAALFGGLLPIMMIATMFRA
jgi:hypothetical protein